MGKLLMANALSNHHLKENFKIFYTMIKKAVIIEDEMAGYNNLKNMLAFHCKEVKVVAHAKNVKEGIVLLNQPVQPDLAFLDINLPDGLVFKLLDNISSINFQLIFVTAYKSFIEKACEYSCLGYITKPIDPDKLIKAVGHCRPERMAKRLEVFKSIYFGHPNAFHRMVLPSTKGDILIDISDITYLKADDTCTYFYLNNGKRVFGSKNIGKYEAWLSDYHFFKTKKGHVINLNYLDFCPRGESSYVVMKDGTKVPISKRCKPRLNKFLKQYQVI